MSQPETGGVRTTEGEGDKLETPSDDEEITIPSQNSADIWNVDIRDEQSENTQQEDWLLHTEPKHGARPRQTGGERPPAMEDLVLRDAADVSAVRHLNGTLRLSPGRRIFREEDVFTPPRGGDLALSLRVCKKRHELCLRFFRRTLNEMVVKVRRMSGRRYIC